MYVSIPPRHFGAVTNHNDDNVNENIKTIQAGHSGETSKLYRRADSEDDFMEEEFDSIVEETLKEKQSILAELNSQVLQTQLYNADIAEEIEETDRSNWTIEFKSKSIKLTK
jgi:hypothetical protein